MSDEDTKRWFEGRLEDNIEKVKKDGKNCIKVTFDKSSKGTDRVTDEFDFDPVDAATLNYDVMFDEKFEFVKGGKLHGLSSSPHISGCSVTEEDKWSERIMWKQDGLIALYSYNQDRESNCGDNTYSKVCFEKDIWYTVSVYVKVNSNNKRDGNTKVYLDGNLIAETTSNENRKEYGNNTRVARFMFCTFHGGSSSEWSPDQHKVYAYMDNFNVVEGDNPIPRYNVPIVDDSNDVIDINPQPIVDDNNNVIDTLESFNFSHDFGDYASPMTGWATSDDNPPSQKKGFNIQWGYIMPHLICKEKDPNTWDWKSVDALIRLAHNLGNHLILRMAVSAPNWKVWDLACGDRDDCEGEGRKTRVPKYLNKLYDTYDDMDDWNRPDWSNEELKNWYKLFVTEYAKKYKDDKTIFLTQGFFGHWAEGHCYNDEDNQEETNLVEKGRFPDKEYYSEFLTHAYETFNDNDMLWAIGIIFPDWGTASWEELYKVEFDKRIKFGTFDDTFNHSENEIFNWNDSLHERLKDITELYKTYPLGGEITFSPKEVREDLMEDNNIKECIDRLKTYKISYMFIVQTEDNDNSKNWIRGAKSMGYKLEITNIKCDIDESKTYITVKNIGIAPVYKDMYVKIEDTQSAVSLAYLQPDAHIEVPIDTLMLQRSKISITSEWSKKSDGIPFSADDINVTYN